MYEVVDESEATGPDSGRESGYTDKKGSVVRSRIVARQFATKIPGNTCSLGDTRTPQFLRAIMSNLATGQGQGAACGRRHISVFTRHQSWSTSTCGHQQDQREKGKTLEAEAGDARPQDSNQNRGRITMRRSWRRCWAREGRSSIRVHDLVGSGYRANRS